MNIFVLDESPTLSAAYHCDKHVPKMILESAQMLSTVLGGPYKPTHQNHPCTAWAGRTRANAFWLFSLTMALDEEYRYRFGHEHSHKSAVVVANMFNEGLLNQLPRGGLTPFALAMPEEYKTDNAVESYRAYYRSKTFAKWDRADEPQWWRA